MYWKIHPPQPSRFPSGGDFAPLGPRDSLGPRGAKPRPWEISWASGGVFSNTSLLSAVYGYIVFINIEQQTSLHENYFTIHFHSQNAFEGSCFV